MKVPSHLFCDTLFFYACLDSSDINHDHAMSLVSKVAEAKTTLSATWDILSETVILLRYRRHFQAALEFLTEVKPKLHIIPLSDEVRFQAEQVFRQYGKEHRLSFCDGISFVVVTTLLDHSPCLAFNDDFRGLGLTVLS